MTPAERKALAFFAAIAALGVGARAAGLGAPPPAAVSGDAPADERAALDRQLAAVDSARASRQRRPKRGAKGAARGRAGAPGPSLTPPAPAADSRTEPRPLARPVPIDADQADSAALEALPGVGPALAHRIVADRATHGPFGSMNGLSRVPGIGPGLEARLRPLVTFSGRPGARLPP